MPSQLKESCKGSKKMSMSLLKALGWRCGPSLGRQPGAERSERPPRSWV